MEELLKEFVGKTLRLYSISGVESYLGVLDGVESGYIRFRELYSKQMVYIAIPHIESFKEVVSA